MPELPEVETVVNGIRPFFETSTILSMDLKRPNLRFPFPPSFQDRLVGTTVTKVYRRAKYICMDLSSKETLLCHLGMSGRLILDESEEASKHDHVFFTMSQQSSQKVIRYRDPRRFGFMDLVKTREFSNSKFIKHLGPEPLEADFSVPYLQSQLKTKKMPIKTALMDAKIVVGVGNIYASEALFYANIHPQTPAMHVADNENTIKRLIHSIQNVLQGAILSGGSTLRDHVRPDGKLGYFQHNFRVYDKAGTLCKTCKTASIEKIVQSGRSTFFCPHCQRI